MRISLSAKGKIVLSMAIFGTLSLVVRGITLPSGVIAMGRGVIGAAFLLGWMALRGQRFDLAAVRRNAPWLIPSGGLLGFNWILLFEAYKYTTVAAATLCYYMAPVLIVLAASVLLRERLTLRRGLCVLCALGGMVLVSGVLRRLPTRTELLGLLLGLAAAVFYAGVVLLNKHITGLSAEDRTVAQLLISATILLPYNLITVKAPELMFSGKTVLLLLVAGVVYTGVTYALYFGALERVQAQTAAILSYIDPVVAVLVSVCIFRERLDMLALLGAVMIVGAAVVSELEPPAQKPPDA